MCLNRARTVLSGGRIARCVPTGKADVSVRRPALDRRNEGQSTATLLLRLAYTLVETLRRLALKGTEWAQAQVDTIRLKLFKIGAIVRISVRRILLQLSSAYAWKDIFAHAFHALRC